ncbi:MAG: glutathione S-transferase N-terminal domain-containing protein [Magnetovibrionaceae bacterium]
MSIQKHRLFVSSASPYVRKCTASVLYHGLDQDFEFLPATSWDETSDYRSNNPFGKVPALKTTDGTCYIDSPVIAEVIDQMGSAEKLFPVDPIARLDALRRMAVGDNLLDVAVAMIYENRRTDTEPSAFWLDRWATGMKTGLDALEAEADTWGDRLDIGTLSIACSLGYLDFRYGDTPWAPDRPALADWFDRFSDHDFFQKTLPKDPT